MPSVPATSLNGVPVDGYPALAPEAGRGRVRRVTIVGEDVLRRRCTPVTRFATDELDQLVADLFRTMYASAGVGLAANQIGVGLRVFAYDCTDDDGVRHVGHVVNPVLDKPSAAAARDLDVSGEGCLSVPGPVRDVARPATARLRGVDAQGRPLLLEGSGYFGRCLQHETDHLSGRLYIDQLAKAERKSALAEMERVLPEIMEARAARAAELDALLGRA